MKLKSSVALACLLGVMGVRAATTFEGLKGEIAAAEEGATVYVEADMEYTEALQIERSVTLASPEGQTNTLLRAAGNTQGTFAALTEGTTLTVRDLVVDGNKAAGKSTGNLVIVGDKLNLVMERGATFQNYIREDNEGGGGPGTVLVWGTGVLTMNEGSCIRDCENFHYGSAVQIGASDGRIDDGKLVMNGGEISGCRGHHETYDNDWDGAVYVYGGRFDFHGGNIVSNISDNCVGGVVLYRGEMTVKGAGRIIDNVGKNVNNLAISSRWDYDNTWDECVSMKVIGDYTGEMTVKTWDGRENLENPDERGTYRIWQDQNVHYDGTANIALEGTNLHLNGNRLMWGYYPVWQVPVARTSKYWIHDFKDNLWRAIQPSTTDTVTLHADWPMMTDWYFAFPSNTDITVRSAPGERRVISREVTNDGSYWWIQPDSKLRLENVVVDGKAEEYACTNSFWSAILCVDTRSELYLNAGAEIRNARAKSDIDSATAGVLGLHDAYVEMNEGASIHGMVAESVGAYGSAIRILSGARFRMNGGVISNCVCHTRDQGTAYGGTVYTHGSDWEDAFVDLRGGIITCNDAGDCPSGVLVYRGNCTISGDIQIRDNLGPYPDLYLVSDERGTAKMVGDFRGWVGVSSGEQVFDKSTNIDWEPDATGAWNFHATAASRAEDFVGYAWSNAKDNYYKVYFGRADGWVDGIGYDNRYEERKAAIVPTAIDVDGDALPHTFRGAARAFGGTVDVTFDADRMLAYFKDKGAPIRLLEGLEGPLTGAWNFSLPPCASGAWVVRAVTDAAGVVAYDLRWSPTATVMFVR